MKYFGIKLIKFKFLAIIFTIVAVFTTSIIHLYSNTYYSVLYPELSLMRIEASKKEDWGAEGIFIQIQDYRDYADRFYFDPNDDKYEVYVDTPSGQRVVVRMSQRKDELIIIDYHQKIQRRRTISTRLFWEAVQRFRKELFSDAIIMFVYVKDADSFFLPPYCSLFTIYSALERLEEADRVLEELKNQFSALRKYDYTYMTVVPEEAIIQQYMKEIPEKIKGTRLQEVMIEEKPYIVIASTYLSPELISEKAPLYAPRVIRPGSSNSPF